jgi:hypothetical protein
MLSYCPDDSARQHVRDLIATANKKTQQQAWHIKKAYTLESRALKYERWDRTTPRRSLA